MSVSVSGSGFIRGQVAMESQGTQEVEGGGSARGRGR